MDVVDVPVLVDDVAVPAHQPAGREQPVHPHGPARVDPTRADPNLPGNQRRGGGEEKESVRASDSGVG